MRISDWSSDVCSSDLITQVQREAEANWLAENQPELWRDTAHFLLLSGWLNWRLCGDYVDSSGSQVGYLPFDYKRLTWAGPRDFKWRALAVRREQLPDLRAPSQTLGALTAQAADALRSEEHTSELQSLMRLSYAVF